MFPCSVPGSRDPPAPPWRWEEEEEGGGGGRQGLEGSGSASITLSLLPWGSRTHLGQRRVDVLGLAVATRDGGER